MTLDPQAVAAAVAPIVAQSVGAGLDWSKVLQLLVTVGVGALAYLGATYKARHDAKLLQGGELAKQTELLFGGWETMTERAQQIIDRQQAEMMAATARAVELQRELSEKERELSETQLALEEARRHYKEALRELEELRVAARDRKTAVRNKRTTEGGT